MFQAVCIWDCARYFMSFPQCCWTFLLMTRSSQTWTCWLFQVRNSIQEGDRDAGRTEELQHRICAESIPLSAQRWSRESFWSSLRLSDLFLKCSNLVLIRQELMAPAPTGRPSGERVGSVWMRKVARSCPAVQHTHPHHPFSFLHVVHMDIEEQCNGWFVVLYILVLA